MVRVAMLICSVLVVACVDPTPQLPTVRLVTWQDQPELAEYVDGARAWDALGFTVATVPLELDECDRDWHVQSVTDCIITIGVKRDPMLRIREGTNALANISERHMTIDASVVDRFQLLTAVAHEAGHILLDTPEHTQGGVMGGASWSLEAVDYELACDTIGVCL